MEDLELQLKDASDSDLAVSSESDDSGASSRRAGARVGRSPELDLNAQLAAVGDSDSDTPTTGGRRTSANTEEVAPVEPPCLSTLDEITADLLQEKHVCWVSPDGSARMCFNFATLLNIAATVGKGQWRQPPHFRTEMEPAMRAQLKARPPWTRATRHTLAPSNCCARAALAGPLPEALHGGGGAAAEVDDAAAGVAAVRRSVRAVAVPPAQRPLRPARLPDLLQLAAGRATACTCSGARTRVTLGHR